MIKKIRNYFHKLTFMYSQGYSFKIWMFYFYKLIVSHLWKTQKVITQNKYNSMIWEWGLKYLEKFKKSSLDESYYDFNGALIPYEINNKKIMNYGVFLTTFYFHCFLNNDYSYKKVNKFDALIPESAYCIVTNEIDVTIKKDDVVIDAGAWIGDFAAFACIMGAITYAFEPVSCTYKWLKKTAKLNNKKIGYRSIIPIKKGLSNVNEKIDMFTESTSGSNSFVLNRDSKEKIIEKVSVTTLDNFVKNMNLKKVDFIKADIEGAERLMLEGAQEVLKMFAPKLAICTYHLPDDPVVLESLIKKANPQYKIIHTNKKLYASIPNK